MKVLQATAWYPPFHLGGSEVYLEGLVRELRRSGIESAVVTPRIAASPERYVHAGTPVETYPLNEAPAPNEIEDVTPHLDFEISVRICCAIARDLSPFLTRGSGSHHLRGAPELRFRAVPIIRVPGSDSRISIEASVS